MSDDYFDEYINEEPERDDFDESEEQTSPEDVDSRSVVLVKQDMIALLGLKTSTGGGLIIRVDPRQKNPAAQTYDDPEAATKWFNRSLRTSRRNGWVVIYDGSPAFG
jgi:hypothetical protein